MKATVLSVCGACLFAAGSAALYVGYFGSAISYTGEYFHLAPTFPENPLWAELVQRWIPALFGAGILFWWGLRPALARKAIAARKWRFQTDIAAMVLLGSLLALLLAGRFFGQSWALPWLFEAYDFASAVLFTVGILFGLIFAFWPENYFLGEPLGLARRCFSGVLASLALLLFLSSYYPSRALRYPAMNYDTGSVAGGAGALYSFSANVRGGLPQRWPPELPLDFVMSASLEDFDKAGDPYALRLEKSKTYTLRADIAAAGFALEPAPGFREIQPLGGWDARKWEFSVLPKPEDWSGERKLRAEIFLVDAADGRDVFASPIYVLEIASGTPWGLPRWLVSPITASLAIAAGLAAIVFGFVLQKRRDGEID